MALKRIRGLSAQAAASLVTERHQRILELARHAGRVSVEELAETLAVTPQTVRKDLKTLARRNMVSRIHGGATVMSGTDNIAYEERRLVASGPKATIGAAAAALIPNGSSLFVNIGTTTEAVVQNLVHHQDLLVITNNLNVVDMLSPFTGIETVVVGGRLRRHDRAIVGPLAVGFISNFLVDFAIIGASAIDPSGRILDFDESEVQVSQTLIAHARQTMLVADSSKIDRPAPLRICGLDEIDYFVTDRLCDQRLGDACAAAGVAVIEAHAASVGETPA